MWPSIIEKCNSWTLLTYVFVGNKVILTAFKLPTCISIGNCVEKLLYYQQSCRSVAFNISLWHTKLFNFIYFLLFFSFIFPSLPSLSSSRPYRGGTFQHLYPSRRSRHWLNIAERSRIKESIRVASTMLDPMLPCYGEESITSTPMEYLSVDLLLRRAWR